MNEAQEGRINRGGGVGDEDDIRPFLDPNLPTARQPRLGAADSFNQIERLGAWECAPSVFHSMEDVPLSVRAGWGEAVAEVLKRIEEADTESKLEKALLWWLLLPQDFLRQPTR